MRVSAYNKLLCNLTGQYFEISAISYLSSYRLTNNFSFSNKLFYGLYPDHKRPIISLNFYSLFGYFFLLRSRPLKSTYPIKYEEYFWKNFFDNHKLNKNLYPIIAEKMI
ncbi:MAG TPA: hypothetical protein PL122_05500 [Bacteroidales bacterium]|nr:hypothetical protein [Bacteroidales bacterium]